MDTATVASDQRRHARFNVLCAVLVAPNGHSHEGYILDLSQGGARVDLVPGWTPANGTQLKMFFDVPDSDAITLETHVAWVAVDHMGLRFDESQDAEIGRLLEAAGAV
ncbi:PilZ domain containing protein [Lysobacter dokdonensis DS-58]|uniref:PilZ domain containing protein n=1 Tax=Lysobacter dokdonensis DS-58 TaxID=1300345 RepID=A0A0A2WCC1_9GAMM|nr:PilZ domain-containing protein [Lysobacter dokdonensis]KGQ17711.1 PilZ domain containing protein [Lysobacter dokdonensis DS-58]